MNHRPGTLHPTHQELSRRKKARDKAPSKRPAPLRCPDCESRLAKIKDENGIDDHVCILCRARKLREVRKDKSTEADSPPILACKRVGDQLILEAPLGTFTIDAESGSLAEEPRTEDEDLYMPTDRRPGSLDKLNAMRSRFARGLPVFHSEDAGAWTQDVHTGQSVMMATKREQTQLVKQKPVSAGAVWDLDKEHQAAAAEAV